MKRYTAVVHIDTYEKIWEYFEFLKAGNSAGYYLQTIINSIDLDRLNISDFIKLILNTKRPQLYAESDLWGDGRDWNGVELSILGNILIYADVIAFDNGLHNNPKIHNDPFNVGLIFVPGALLDNGKGILPVDWSVVDENNNLNFFAYYKLYERRLIPAFVLINSIMEDRNKKAFVTIPGIGCGQFSGNFYGALELQFNYVLQSLIKDHSDKFPNAV